MSLGGIATVWPVFFGALSTVLLLSGLDDLVPTAICLWNALVRRKLHTPAPETEAERRIAIFVPCWRESGVIGNMIRHNVASIWYRNYDFFLGVYPNDTETVAVAQQLERNFRRVHVAVCPHAGPTSKADCLNWVYRKMLAFEKEHAVSFDTVVLHDAEDLIHPEALSVINRERAENAMVQVPVLPLRTPALEVTHGVYCDEFSEFQTIDMPARQFCRSFIPSNGVGTGFARSVLERLSQERNGLVFNPASLTEDYEIGVYIHGAGLSQVFVPLRTGAAGICATREYFPRRFRSAIRQRTRWVTGIALQSWARDGWRGSWRTKYWFWRDRKGLWANPLSLLTNVLFVLGACDWAAAGLEHRRWAFALASPILLRLCAAASSLQLVRLVGRSIYTTRLFGWQLGIGVPVRALHANLINCCASVGAVWQFSRAHWGGPALAWLKTDHAYPTAEVLQTASLRRLSEVLLERACLRAETLTEVETELRSDHYLAEYLVERGYVSEEHICAAQSQQAGVPFSRIDARRVRGVVARGLPVHVMERWGIVPFAVIGGQLAIAGRRPPTPAMYQELRRYTTLPVEFHLITRSDYQELRGLAGRQLDQVRRGM